MIFWYKFLIYFYLFFNILVSTIDAIKEIAKDSSAFWFGSSVTSLCNKTHTTTACKINPRPGHVDSIVSRFGGNVDISQVDRLTKILYTYSNGNLDNKIFTHVDICFIF